MNDTVPSARSEGPQDFRLLIGTEPFDPREVRSPAQRRGAAALSGRREAAREAMIVQFAAALTGPDAARLEAAYGLKLDRYIPHLAYLERLPAETVDRLRGDFLVRACIALAPALKLAPWIGAAGGQPPPGAPLELIATVFDDADISAVEAALGAIGVREVQIVDDRPSGGRVHAYFVLDDLARLAQIADLDDVVWVEPVPVIVSANVEAAQTIQSGTVGTRGSPIWDHGLYGEGQVVSVFEGEKLDIVHSFFADPISIHPGPGHRKVLAIIGRFSVGDLGRHCTRVAGIAAGDEFGNSGQHRHRGGAWKAKLVCCGHVSLSQRPLGSFYTLLTEARDAGAFIHNNSWSEQDIMFYSKIAHDADDFSWVNEYHVVIASGRNTGAPYNSSPGIAKNTLCVAAAKAFPDEMKRGSGVSGPTRDGRRKPDLMAVGCGISAAVAGTPSDTMERPCSTSFAAPHVSAAAALVRQYFMEGWYPYGEKKKEFEFMPTGALIRAVLLNSTVDMTGHPGYPSDDEGWGLIRLNRTLYFSGGPRRLVVKDVPHAVGLESEEQRTNWLYVNSRTEQLKLTLVWTDPPPGEHGYLRPSMNTITFTVQDPGGLKYLGNDFNIISGVSTGVSRPNGAGPQDLLNNVQMVIVNNPPVGQWRITLRMDKVNKGDKGDKQGYALVASGGLQGVFFPILMDRDHRTQR